MPPRVEEGFLKIDLALNWGGGFTAGGAFFAEKIAGFF